MVSDSLTTKFPPLDVERLLSSQTPPPQFAEARFGTYIPDIAQPSQSAALRRMRALAHSLARKQSRLKGLFTRNQAATGIYLDGGYGVGKTHLLAALAHEVGPEESTYGTFVEYTHLVGALGYAATIARLRTRSVVCIDEFELDDPGDTLIMSRLIRDLSDAGVRVVATSNTQPEALGEGRFAAQDFKREIQSLAKRFEILRIDGPDYRARTLTLDLPVPSDSRVAAAADSTPGATADEFTDLLAHLSAVHPSRYGQLIDGVTLAGLTGGHTIDNDAVGLRFVVLIDRLYDRSIPVLLSGVSVGEVFSQRLRTGGYRKKYFRAMSRLAALVEHGELSGSDQLSKESTFGGTNSP